MKMEPYIHRLMQSFSGSFINEINEIILYPETNLYFRLDDVNSEFDVKCKLLEWCSRDAYKTKPYDNELKNKVYQEEIMDNINNYLNTNFTKEKMELIYTKLGNAINHNLTIKFVESGYDTKILESNMYE